MGSVMVASLPLKEAARVRSPSLLEMNVAFAVVAELVYAQR
jgi:hypothetical protein